MGLVAAKATVQTGTGIAGTTIDVSLDLGGATPKVIRARCVGRTDTTNANGLSNINASHGLAAGASSQGCMSSFAGHNVSPSTASKTIRTDCIVQSLSAGGSTGKLAVNAVSANSVQFIVVEQFTANLAVQIDVLAGTDISNAKVHAWVLGVGTGAQSITGVGHGARYVESIFNAATLDGATTNTINTCWGRSYIPSGLNQCFSTRIGHNVSPSVTNRYMNDAEGGALAGSASVIGRFTVTASTSDGFDIDRIEAPAGAWDVLSLVMDGTFRCNMGSGLTETGSNVTGFDPGFSPALSLVDSHCTVESTIDTQQTNAFLSSGSLLGRIGAQSCMAFRATDSASPTICSTGIAYDSVYIFPDNVGGLNGKMGAVTPGLTAADRTKVALQMSDPDPTQNFYIWTSFAPATVSAGSTLIKDVQISATGTTTGTIALSMPNLLAAGEPVKAIIVHAAGYPNGGDPSIFAAAAGDIRFSYGWGCRSGAQIAYAAFVGTAQNPTVVGRGRIPGSVMIAVDATGAQVGALSWIPTNVAGEVLLNITDAFPADQLFEVEALGGVAISNAAIIEADRTTGAGSLAITTGVAPRYAEFLNAQLASGSNAATGALFSLGRCFLPDLSQHQIAFSSENGVNPTNTAAYGTDGEVISDITYTSGGAFGGRSAVSASDATSLTLNRIESGSTEQIHIFVLEGAFSGALGSFQTRVDSTAFGPGASSFGTHKGESLWGAGATSKTADTSVATAALSIGGYAPASYEGTSALVDPDGVTPSAPARGFAGNTVMIIGPDGTGTNRTGDGTYQIPGGDSAQRWVFYAFLGDQQAASSSGADRRRFGKERGSQMNRSQLRRGGFGVY